MNMITPYGLNYTIRDWSQCRGQLLPLTQFTALFSLLGTMYGGNGVNSFGLPNLQSRSPVGIGSGPGLHFIPQGAMGGGETVTLTPLQMPAHDHVVSATGQFAEVSTGLSVSNDAATSENPDGQYLGVGSGPVKPYTTSLSNPAGSQTDVIDVPARGVQVTGATQNAGNSQSFNIRNPYQGVNYQICLEGIYPSRS